MSSGYSSVTYTYTCTYKSHQTEPASYQSYGKRVMKEEDDPKDFGLIFITFGGARLHTGYWFPLLHEFFPSYSKRKDFDELLTQLLKYLEVPGVISPKTYTHLAGVYRSLVMLQDDSILSSTLEVFPMERIPQKVWFMLLTDGDWFSTTCATIRVVPAEILMNYITLPASEGGYRGKDFVDAVEELRPEDDFFYLPVGMLETFLS